MASLTAPVPNSDSALDHEIFGGLLELVEPDDDSFVVELFDSYVASASECLSGIEAAIAGGDPVALREHAQSLKGASANVGAAHVAACAESLQLTGDAGSVDGATAWVDAIREELPRVYAAVHEAVPGFTPPDAGS